MINHIQLLKILMTFKQQRCQNYPGNLDFYISLVR